MNLAVSRFTSRLTFAALVIAVAGCSSIGLESKKIDYKTASAVKVPTLEIPPDLTSPTRDDRFAVPDTGGKGTATFSAYAGERSPGARSQQPSEVLPEVDAEAFSHGIHRQGKAAHQGLDDGPAQQVVR